MENNNNIAEIHWGKTISEARTYEEYHHRLWMYSPVTRNSMTGRTKTGQRSLTCTALIRRNDALSSKFNKPLDQLETTLDKGLYVLKNMKNLTQMPKQYANSVFALLFSTAKLAKLSKEEQKMIDEAQKAKWDEYAIHKAAVDTGLRQGRNQRNREIAEKMLLKNKPIEEITDFTELSEADVLAIKAALGKS